MYVLLRASAVLCSVPSSYVMITGAARDSEATSTILTPEKILRTWIRLYWAPIYAWKHLSVTNNMTACTRLIEAASDLPRGRKRTKCENAKIQKGHILDISPVYRHAERFQEIQLTLSDTYAIVVSRLYSFLCTYFSRNIDFSRSQKQKRVFGEYLKIAGEIWRL